MPVLDRVVTIGGQEHWAGFLRETDQEQLEASIAQTRQRVRYIIRWIDPDDRPSSNSTLVDGGQEFVVTATREATGREAGFRSSPARRRFMVIEAKGYQ